MAPVTINPLPEGLFALSVTPPSFEGLVADTLGNAATETDGFDAAIQDIALALESESAGLSAVDAHLEDAAFVVGQFGADNLDPIALEIAQAIGAGDPIVDELDALLG